MNSYDFIKIEGLDGERPQAVDPGVYECFTTQQDSFSSAFADIDGNTYLRILSRQPRISVDEEIEQDVWNAQNGMIQRDIDRVNALSDDYRRKRDEIPKKDSPWVIVIGEFIEEIVAAAAGLIVEAKTGSPALREITGFVVGTLFGLALEYLKDAYNKNIQVCQALVTEDEALLQLEVTRENYDIRTRALMLHTEIIENMQASIHHAETMVQQMGGLETSDIVRALEDLTYNDEVIDFGTCRLHLKAKVIEYK